MDFLPGELCQQIMCPEPGFLTLFKEYFYKIPWWVSG